MAEYTTFTEDRLVSRNARHLSNPCFGENNDFAVSLRKSKRLENSSKKRRVFLESSPLPSQGSSLPTTVTRANLAYLSTLILTSDVPNSQPHALRTLKHIYTLGDMLAFKISMDLNIIPSLISIATDPNTDQDCLKQAAGCLCNLSAGPSFMVTALVSQGIIPICKDLMQIKDKELMESAIWCISNVAGDSKEHREAVLKLGILDLLLDMFISLQFMAGTLVWTFKNLVESGPSLKEASLKRLLNVLHCTSKTRNEAMLIECLWVVSHIADGGLGNTQLLLDHKIMGRVLKCIKTCSTKICHPAIRAIGNIAAGTADQIQRLLDKGILDIVYAQYENTKSNKIKKYLMWTVSNLTGGIRAHIMIITGHPILIKAVSAISHADSEVRKNAVEVMVNIVKLGAHASVMALVNVGIIKESVEFLENIKDIELTVKILEVLREVLKILEGSFGSEIVSLMHKARLGDALEKTMMIKNKDIEESARGLMKQLEGEDDSREFHFS